VAYSPGNKRAVGWLIALTLRLKLNVIILYEDDYRNNVVKPIRNTTKTTLGEEFREKFSVTSEMTKPLYHKDEIQHRKLANRGGNLKSLFRITSDLYRTTQFPQFMKG
jgi:hypothetical protein